MTARAQCLLPTPLGKTLGLEAAAEGEEKARGRGRVVLAHRPVATVDRNQLPRKPRTHAHFAEAASSSAMDYGRRVTTAPPAAKCASTLQSSSAADPEKRKVKPSGNPVRRRAQVASERLPVRSVGVKIFISCTFISVCMFRAGIHFGVCVYLRALGRSSGSTVTALSRLLRAPVYLCSAPSSGSAHSTLLVPRRREIARGLDPAPVSESVFLRVSVFVPVSPTAIVAPTPLCPLGWTSSRRVSRSRFPAPYPRC
ncbi:hypothetical protein BKA62DRAFT_303296 [Auriculariales sp. MPI-PUGE-AT-0066]|nr:hypothetical protein BKA62DRAFT_303296 [Auriculariales sp. MPI-PUGE-AT-0066]